MPPPPPPANLRAAFHRGFLRARGRAPSARELDDLVAAELAAAARDGHARLRIRPRDRGAPGVPPPETAAAPPAPADWRDAGHALRQAKAHGIPSLTAAVARFAEHLGPAAPALQAAMAEFHIAKRCEGLGEPNLRAYREHIAAFAAPLGDPPLAAVTPNRVAAHLLRWSDSATRANRWQHLATFFTWAVRRGYLAHNPVFQAMRKPARPQSERCVFTPAETRELLARVKHTPAIGYWAVALFAGLRTGEVCRLQAHPDPWSLIHRDTGVIDLRDQPLKCGPRVVPILPVLHSWLDWIRDRGAPFLPPNFWKARRHLKREVLFDRFGTSVGSRTHEAVPFHDMARRTYLAYRLALPGLSHADVSNDVGNSEANLRKFYARRASRGDARRYFSLTPDRV